jgi:hypothetical protein
MLVFNMDVNQKMMLLLVCIFGVCMLSQLTVVFADSEGADVKITGVDDLTIPDLYVRKNDRIEIQARLADYDWRIMGPDSWMPLRGRILRLEVYNSTNARIFTDKTITNIWTSNANFSIFRLNTSGTYTAKLIYAGDHGYRPCTYTFKINVNDDSAPEYGDTRVTAPDGLTVYEGDDLEIQAGLDEYQELYFIEDYTRWHPLHGRYLDMTVVNSKGETVHKDRAMTNLWTYNANFDVFRLNDAGNYVCYINYTGNLKPSMKKFVIRVNLKT